MYLYILLCSDGTYYIGTAADLDQRIAQHNSATFENSYTSTRRPVQLIFSEYFKDKRDAAMAEHKIKKWSRAKKEAVINGKYDLLTSLAKKKFK